MKEQPAGTLAIHWRVQTSERVRQPALRHEHKQAAAVYLQDAGELGVAVGDVAACRGKHGRRAGSLRWPVQ